MNIGASQTVSMTCASDFVFMIPEGNPVRSKYRLEVVATIANRPEWRSRTPQKVSRFSHKNSVYDGTRRPTRRQRCCSPLDYILPAPVAGFLCPALGVSGASAPLNSFGSYGTGPGGHCSTEGQIAVTTESGGVFGSLRTDSSPAFPSGVL